MKLWMIESAKKHQLSGVLPWSLVSSNWVMGSRWCVEVCRWEHRKWSDRCLWLSRFMGGETFSAAWCLSPQWGFNYGNQWKTLLLLFHRKAIMLLLWTTQTSPACLFAIPVCGDLVAFWCSKNGHVSYHTSTVHASKAFISHSQETGYVLSSEGKQLSSNCDELTEEKKQHLITDIEAVWITSGTVYNHFAISMWELTIGCNYHQTLCHTYMPISSKLQHCNNGSTHVSVF